MKRILSIMAARVVTVSSCAAVYAEAAELLTAAAPAEKYSVTVNGEKQDFGGKTAYASGKNIMLPLRAVAEKLGFKVEWNEAEQGIHLDDGEVNTTIYIGKDTYFMASSTAIGMSAPTPLGAAPVLDGDTTFAPAEMFGILLGADAVSVKDGTVDIKKEEKTQIPNPIVEYKTVEEAKNAVPFEPAVPTKMPADCKLSFISAISGEVFQLTYSGENREITYRTALGDEDISGDYNVYENVKKVTAGDVTVELRLGEKSSCAVWTKGENTFSLFVDGESNEAELVGIVSGI